MFSSWTFGRRIGAGFGAIALLAALIGVIGITALRTVVASQEQLVTVTAHRLLEVEEMRVARERRAKAVRSYLIARDDKYIRDMQGARDDVVARLAHLRSTTQSAEEGKLIEAVAGANAEMQAAWDEVVAVRKGGAELEAIVTAFERNQAKVRALDAAMTALSEEDARALEAGKRAAASDADHAITRLALISLLAAALAAAAAVVLSRSLRVRVDASLHAIQGSSAELEVASQQQLKSSQLLASTTSEIGTTTRELLATSRQIAESSQRVVRVAEETAASARGGDATVQRASEAIAGIRRQVDVIVGHMLTLGKRSQEIGGILELINELAEQTNILSINATIEAAGAGEAGRRFAVVADEIRRLADRVGGSARDVRALVEEIRAAVNTAVMATEDGTKAVETGARQFGEVLTSFKHIADKAAITTDSAREIELSTKQQATAVEQVNAAISGVAQVAKETEASTKQTRETSAELGAVSRRLAGLVRAKY